MGQAKKLGNNIIFVKKKAIETQDIKLLQSIFPAELMKYFKITGFQTLTVPSLKRGKSERD